MMTFHERISHLLLLFLMFSMLVVDGSPDQETKNPCALVSIKQTTSYLLGSLVKKLKRQSKQSTSNVELDQVSGQIEELSTVIQNLGTKVISALQNSTSSSDEPSNSTPFLPNVTAAIDEEQILSKIGLANNKTQQLLQYLVDMDEKTKAMLNKSLEAEIENLVLVDKILKKINKMAVVQNDQKMAEQRILDKIYNLTSIEKNQTKLLNLIKTQLNDTDKMILEEIIADSDMRTLERTLEDQKQRNVRLKKENAFLKVESVVKKSIVSPYRAIDCSDHYMAGHTESGVYTIFPTRCSDSIHGVEVWCFMDSANKYQEALLEQNDNETLFDFTGGWTVILNRELELYSALTNGSDSTGVNFTRSFREYEAGFGDPSGEYFVGLTALNQMTETKRFSLAILAEWKATKIIYAKWSKIEVLEKEHEYQLKVGRFWPQSTMPDVMKAHDRQMFSTYDKDNDYSYVHHCASLHRGGWWYRRCYDILPTGEWGVGVNGHRGISIGGWGNEGGLAAKPVTKILMMMMPRHLDKN